LILIIAPLLLLLFKMNFLPQKVPLFYSRPWGEEQLTSPLYLYLLPGFSLLLFLANFQLSRMLLKKGERFLALTGSGFSLLFSFLAAIALIKIVFLIS
jgi:hypothetical protein